MLQGLIDFFKKQKVLVTGHTGFKGSWLCLLLKELGAEVHGFSLPLDPNRYRFADQIKLKDRVNTINGDVTDFKDVLQDVTRIEPTIIIHMAAQSLVPEGYQQPRLTLQTNVMGSINVLEAGRLVPSVRAVQNITTDKCYENLEQQKPFVESDPLGGRDPYSASKAASEIASKAYYHSFYKDAGKVLISARAGNVIGGGDFSPKRLIPDIMHAIEHQDTIVLRNPQAVRPWQFVLDPLVGYLQYLMVACTTADFPLALNFAPIKEQQLNTSVQTVTEKMIEICNYDQSKVKIVPEDFHESQVLTLDNSLAASKISWQPLIDNEMMLNWTASWYACYLNEHAQISKFTEQQLTNYLEKLRA